MRAIDFFDRSAELYPNRICSADDDNEISYSEAYALSCQISRRLVREDVPEETKIGILCPNVAIAVPIILGVIRSGCTWLPINPRNSASDNLQIMENNDCEWIFYHSDYQALARELSDRPSRHLRSVCIDDDCLDGEGLTSWIEGEPVLPTERGLDRDHVYKLALSGGTTGMPKGVMHTNLNAQVMISSLLLAFPHKTIPHFLCVAPVTHAAGNLCLWILAAGGTVRLMKKANVENIISNFLKHSITTIFAPPTLIYNMIDHPDISLPDYSCLEYFLYGSAPISAARLKQCISIFGLRMAQIYSQAEATMAITFMAPEDHIAPDDETSLHRLQSAGRAGPLVRLKILSDALEEVPNGTPGELAVFSDLVCKGYYKNPEATSAMLHDGWLLTGDIAYKDDDGFIYLVDRKRDLIVTGGFNVYPNEVEQTIFQIEGVANVCVIGAPDEKWGEAVVAVVVLSSGKNIDESYIIDFCKHQLGSVKSPKKVVFWDDLPLSSNNKILRKDVRAHFWKNQARNLTL